MANTANSNLVYMNFVKKMQDNMQDYIHNSNTQIMHNNMQSNTYKMQDYMYMAP